ncbi:baculoviral IAP repeat-containing protein 5 [Trichogramma pretiosum]|uniref:Uncharacterized protein n=1 Tax=Trichogramma kaykai TaxID=54128 RepID=A0ABD2XF93_9HYME|nr:baculoviral IAP repeat-containing protein 5 [Trichogramma pretiosum]
MTEELDLAAIFKTLNPLFWKKARLETFKHWPFGNEHQCNPDSMAAAGFFAVGGEDEPDLAECFMCRKQLDGWEAEDDPWQEHQKHQSNCSFVQMNKKDEGLLTVKELFQLMQEYHSGRLLLEFDKAAESMRKVWQDASKEIPDIFEKLSNH